MLTVPAPYPSGVWGVNIMEYGAQQCATLSNKIMPPLDYKYMSLPRE